MVKASSSIHNWKKEQLSYFREYIKSFDPGTREYRELERGISELEKTL